MDLDSDQDNPDVNSDKVKTGSEGHCKTIVGDIDVVDAVEKDNFHRNRDQVLGNQVGPSDGNVEIILYQPPTPFCFT